MAKKTYVQLINTVLRELNIKEITSTSNLAGQPAIVANYINDAMDMIYAEEDWYTMYKERIVQTSQDAYINVLVNSTLSAGFTITIAMNGSNYTITEGVGFVIGSDVATTAQNIATAMMLALPAQNAIRTGGSVLIRTVPHNNVGITAITTSETDEDILNVGLADTDTFSLPVDFGRAISIQNVSNPQKLTAWGYQDFDGADPGLTVSGAPQYYSVQGNNFRYFPRPSSVDTMLEKYWRSPTNLVDADDIMVLPLECQLPITTWVRWMMALYLNKSIRATQLSSIFDKQLDSAKDSNFKITNEILVVDSSGAVTGMRSPGMPSNYPRT